MNRMSAIAGVVITLLFLNGVQAEETKPETRTIRLNQIWAYEMPETKDIRKLEPKRATGNLSNEALIRGYLVLQLSKALQNRPKPGEKAGPAFVVAGTDAEALKNAHALMMTKDKKEPPRLLPANTDLSLFFYSYMCDSPPLSDSVGDRIMVPVGGPKDERARAGSATSLAAV